MVEVGAPARDGAVVQHHSVPSDGLAQPVPHPFLALRAAPPIHRGPLRAGDEPGQWGEPAPDGNEARLVPGPPALVFDPGGGAGVSTRVRIAGCVFNGHDRRTVTLRPEKHVQRLAG